MTRAKGAAQRPSPPYVRWMNATLYMDAVITPNRSLSKKGFYWLIGVLVAANLAVGALMISLGALPVPIFLGLDVLGVLLAFRANYRGAGQSERVQVSADEVRVLHQIGASARTVWASPTAFTRVSVIARGEPEARVRLHLSQKALTLARALSPPERVAFADALETAIRQARAERH
jgi:uncharacterized membrane protein